MRKENVRTFESVHDSAMLCLLVALAAMQSKVLGTLGR